jgi:hypothetical protein
MITPISQMRKLRWCELAQSHTGLQWWKWDSMSKIVTVDNSAKCLQVSGRLLLGGHLRGN